MTVISEKIPHHHFSVRVIFLNNRIDHLTDPQMVIIMKQQSFQVSLLHEPSFKLSKTLTKQSCLPFRAYHFPAQRLKNRNKCLFRWKRLISSLCFHKERTFPFLSYLIHITFFLKPCTSSELYNHITSEAKTLKSCLV